MAVHGGKNHCLMKLRERGRIIGEINEELVKEDESNIPELAEKDRKLELMSHSADN